MKHVIYQLSRGNKNNPQCYQECQQIYALGNDGYLILMGCSSFSYPVSCQVREEMMLLANDPIRESIKDYILKGFRE